MRRGSPHVARLERLLQPALGGLRTLLRSAVRAFRAPGPARVVAHRLRPAGQFREAAVMERERLSAIGPPAGDRYADMTPIGR
jgi:hypothetical protein